MQMTNQLIHILTTTPDAATAETLADLLIERRLAACVQILGPLRSVYRWRGRSERATEWLCQIKTKQLLFPAVAQAIKEHHPYEVPEIIALPAVAVTPEYAEWVEQETAVEMPEAGREV